MTMVDLGKEIWKCELCSFDPMKDARYCGGVGSDYRAMFIAESPSPKLGKGKFLGSEGFGKSPADDLFREIRNKYGLGKCYTTDLVKCGIKAGKPDMNKMRNCVKYLKREIDIVKPSVIVAVGFNLKLADKDKEVDFKNFLESLLMTNIPIVKIWHYSYVWNKCQVKKSERKNINNQEINNNKLKIWEKQFVEINRYL